MKPILKTSCQIFANRGDPWITEREQGRHENSKPVVRQLPRKPITSMARRQVSGEWGKFFAQRNVPMSSKKPETFYPDADENPGLDRYLYAGKADKGKEKTASLYGNSQPKSQVKPESIHAQTMRKLAALKARRK